MVTTPRALRFALGFSLAGILPAAGFAATAGESFVGRWALTIPSGSAGWLEVRKEAGYLDGALLWGGGSPEPLASVALDGDALVVTRVRKVERKGADGKVVRTQQFTETVTARLAGNDDLKLTWVNPADDGSKVRTADFTGKRIPALPPRPDLTKLTFGEPIALFNGRDLTGWKVMGKESDSRWVVEQGAMVNRVPKHVPGQPGQRSANIRTEREFEAFNLQVEVNVPEGSNSGVYLKGIYEVQVLDSYGAPLDPHNMGALYARITPTVSAEKRAGEWQTLDMTLIDRHVTVVLNGRKIIDNQPIMGCTGGAMWSDEFRPGPIYLQGDHGTVSYRNLVLRPVLR